MNTSEMNLPDIDRLFIVQNWLIQSIRKELQMKLKLPDSLFDVKPLNFAGKHANGCHFICTLVVDTSPSENDYIDEINRAIREFYQKLQGDTEKAMLSALDLCILTFDGSIQLIRDFEHIGATERAPQFSVNLESNQSLLYVALFIAYYRSEIRKAQYTSLFRHQMAEGVSEEDQIVYFQPIVHLSSDFRSNDATTIDFLHPIGSISKDHRRLPVRLESFLLPMLDYKISKDKLGLLLGSYGDTNNPYAQMHFEQLQNFGSTTHGDRRVHAVKLNQITEQYQWILDMLKDTLHARGSVYDVDEYSSSAFPKASASEPAYADAASPNHPSLFNQVDPDQEP